MSGRGFALHKEPEENGHRKHKPQWKYDEVSYYHRINRDLVKNRIKRKNANSNTGVTKDHRNYIDGTGWREASKPSQGQQKIHAKTCSPTDNNLKVLRLSELELINELMEREKEEKNKRFKEAIRFKKKEPQVETNQHITASFGEWSQKEHGFHQTKKGSDFSKKHLYRGSASKVMDTTCTRGSNPWNNKSPRPYYLKRRYQPPVSSYKHDPSRFKWIAPSLTVNAEIDRNQSSNDIDRSKHSPVNNGMEVENEDSEFYDGDDECATEENFEFMMEFEKMKEEESQFCQQMIEQEQDYFKEPISDTLNEELVENLLIEEGLKTSDKSLSQAGKMDLCGQEQFHHSSKEHLPRIVDAKLNQSRDEESGAKKEIDEEKNSENLLKEEMSKNDFSTQPHDVDGQYDEDYIKEEYPEEECNKINKTSDSKVSVQEDIGEAAIPPIHNSSEKYVSVVQACFKESDVEKSEQNVINVLPPSYAEKKKNRQIVMVADLEKEMMSKLNIIEDGVDSSESSKDVNASDEIKNGADNNEKNSATLKHTTLHPVDSEVKMVAGNCRNVIEKNSCEVPIAKNDWIREKENDEPKAQFHTDEGYTDTTESYTDESGTDETYTDEGISDENHTDESYTDESSDDGKQSGKQDDISSVESESEKTGASCNAETRLRLRTKKAEVTSKKGGTIDQKLRDRCPNIQPILSRKYGGNVRLGNMNLSRNGWRSSAKLYNWRTNKIEELKSEKHKAFGCGSAATKKNIKQVSPGNCDAKKVAATIGEHQLVVKNKKTKERKCDNKIMTKAFCEEREKEERALREELKRLDEEILNNLANGPTFADVMKMPKIVSEMEVYRNAPSSQLDEISEKEVGNVSDETDEELASIAYKKSKVQSLIEKKVNSKERQEVSSENNRRLKEISEASIREVMTECDGLQDDVLTMDNLYARRVKYEKWCKMHRYQPLARLEDFKSDVEKDVLMRETLTVQGQENEVTDRVCQSYGMFQSHWSPEDEEVVLWNDLSGITEYEELKLNEKPVPKSLSREEICGKNCYFGTGKQLHLSPPVDDIDS